MMSARSGGGGGGVDRAAVALLDQVGQVAAVVDVGVREQHGVELRRVEAKIAVAFVGLGPAALEQAAFEQDRWPLASRRYCEPVTVRAAPLKVIFMNSLLG